jgi:uncharacterized membrane protein
MFDRVMIVTTVVSVVGCGLMTGLFFAFSVSVMRALGRLPAEQGIAAMQRINVAILNPAFGLVFGGTAIACLFLAGSAVVTLDRPGAGLRLAGALLFLVGAIVVTMTINVPMNDALAEVDPVGDEGAAVWARYLSRWTAWNHVRAVTSAAALALLAVSLLRQ